MLLAMLAAAATAATGDSLPAGYSAPNWLKKPSSDDLQAAWPRKALRDGVSGRATLSCEVNTHGLLEQCKVTSETPPGAGFGAAALLLTPTFLMKTATGPNGPIRSSVRIPVNFQNDEIAGSYGESNGIIMIVHPVWSAAPTFADVAGAYPRAAGGASGYVSLRCLVNADGALRDCRDLTEEPHDKGFAAAARSLTGKFRLVPVPPGKRGELTYLNLPIRLTSPQSVDFKDRHIGQPTWIRNLDPARVVQVYPAAAAAKGVQTGRGVSQCTVGVDGSLVGCKPLPGEPDGLGFSESAVMVASVMKMNPWTEEGGPVDGAVVRIPIRFNLAPDQPSGPPAKTAASVWLKIPSGDDVAAVYPNGAIDRGLSGYALLDCKVKPDGQMEDCNVVEETPRGLGFGDAALKLVPKFLMKVGPGANGPNRPRTTIPIRFLMR